MSKSSKARSSKVPMIITIILVALIVFVLVFSLIFGKEGQAPSIFGYNIHIMNGKAMGEYIPDKSAVISKVGVIPQVKQVGLCKLDDSKTVTVLLLAAVEERDGEKIYLFKTTTSEDYEVVALKESNILGTAGWISVPLGRVISFAVSKVGIIILLIVPATIILISLLISIAKGLSAPPAENKTEDDEDDEEIEEDEYIKNAAISFRDVDAVPEVSKEAEFVTDNSYPSETKEENVTKPSYSEADDYMTSPRHSDTDEEKSSQPSYSYDYNKPQYADRPDFSNRPQTHTEPQYNANVEPIDIHKETEDLKKDLSLTEQIILEYSPEQIKKPEFNRAYVETMLNSQTRNTVHNEFPRKEPRTVPQTVPQTGGSHHVSLDDNGQAQYNKITPTADVQELEKTLPHIPENASDKTASSIDALLRSVGQQKKETATPLPEGRIEDYKIAPKPKQRNTSTNRALEEMMRMLEKGKK